MDGLNHLSEVFVSARTKLNIAALNGCLVVAAVLGLAFDSWFVFAVVAAVLVAADFHSGLIRPEASRRRGR